MSRKLYVWVDCALMFGMFLLTLCNTPFLHAQAQGAKADLVLHNGKILTVDNNFSVAQAVAVTGNQIVAVGSDRDIMQLAGPNTQVIDLKGRTVIPGLIDTHRHIFAANYDGKMTPEKIRQFPVDFRGVRSAEDVTSQIRGLVQKYGFKPGEWFFVVAQHAGDGGQPDDNKVLFDEITRWELDKATPNNPMVMTEGIPDQNGVVVNSKALDFLMAKYGPFLKKYGRLWLAPNGQPDGHLEAPATRIARIQPAGPDPADIGPEYKLTLDELAAMGITTVSTQLTEDLLKPYQWLETQGQMTIRLPYGRSSDFGTVVDLSHMKEIAKTLGTGTDKIWVISSGPSAVDGAGSRSCLSMTRQADFGAIDKWFPMGQCSLDSEYKGGGGRAVASSNYFREWVLDSAKYGVRLANTHVGGERSVSILLNLVQQAQKDYGRNSTKGWAFDHCQFVNPRDFKQAAQLGIVFSCGPQWIVNDAPKAAKSYGDEVANTMVVPIKSMMDAGIKVVFEADNNNYIWGEYETLQTRKDKTGHVWGPQNSVDRKTVLQMTTRWAADYVLKGDKLGSIEPGKYADLVVLDQDYMTVPVEQFHAIQPQLTLFDGKVVFLTPSFSQEANLKPDGAIISTFDELKSRRKQGTFNPATF